ncbi:MAG: hypothetical protein DI624_06515 [Brevundimonas sp.]|uniref:hypothetical protein n=1 Tax=Brevundimonas sp. TaxID=1871086 RepID=UPI000DB2EC86|nr:hypothetical protein [Brevundimonas sp.]PZT99003.1 MAG: hypothetical protein DI624_06515 [Brevundimonas sp.]
MISVVAGAIARPQATVTSYYGVLRKGGLISTTGRGRSAQHLSSLDVARILIVMLSADSLQEGEAVTRLVGQLRHDRSDEEFNSICDLKFEGALARLIDFKTARLHGRPTNDEGHLGDLNSDDIQVRVTATHMTAEIIVAGETTQFVDLSGANPPVTYPDDWEEVSIEDRLILRAMMEGMSVTREIDQVVISRVVAAMP